MQIKVCGLTNNRNIREIALLHPDYMGFVFHKNSPRDISDTIDQLQLNTIPSHIKKVAVLVDQPLGMVRDILALHRFDAVQLHGDEAPLYCSELMQICMVIKAFRIEDRLPPQLDHYMDNCHMFLFDAKGEHQGGNGIKFNHNILKDYKLKMPFMLSGGIGQSDLSYLLSIEIDCLAGVDLNSRFEISPGYKSITSLKHFIHKLRSHDPVNR